MLTRQGLEFLLRITDHFHGHWEDPGWGQRPTTQTLLLASVGTLAEGIADDAARRQIQGVVARATAASVKSIQEQP
jgi:hypothetical protein